MSFLDDNPEYGAYDPEDFSLSSNWAKGYHKTNNGEIIELRLMTDKHIQNTINFFKDREDISYLENELRARDLIRNKQ